MTLLATATSRTTRDKANGHLCDPLAFFCPWVAAGRETVHCQIEVIRLCPVYDSEGNRLGQVRVVISMARSSSTSNAQRDKRLRDCGSTNAQIIQFAPYLARKQEQQVEARLIHRSPILEGDIRA